MELLAVPFTRRFFTETWERLVTVRGVLRTDETGVQLEFRRSETDFGTVAQHDEIRVVSIPWDEIVSLELRPRVPFRRALRLRTRSLRALDGVPGARGTEVWLSVPRGDRLAARELASSVGLALAEQRLAALEAPSAPPSLPPG
jgi:hypothetical protein